MRHIVAILESGRRRVLCGLASPSPNTPPAERLRKILLRSSQAQTTCTACKAELARLVLEHAAGES